jgi:uncharacterized protein
MNSLSLIDTGVMVALVDKKSRGHQECLQAFASLSLPPITTWACLTEAFYLIGKLSGWPGQKTLLALLTEKAIRIYSPSESEIIRISELMKQYHDNPMDFADASLVALAEQSDIRQILTLDRDFYRYQIYNKEGFDVIRPATQ